MRPDDTNPPQDPRGSITPPRRAYEGQHDAVASMTRQQIDKIYTQQDEAQPTAAPSVQKNETSVYNKTHGESHIVNKDDWQQYHSAWQNYYQQYYGRYYQSAFHQVKQEAQQATVLAELETPKEDVVDEKQAMNELRGQLLEKVQTSATKVRKSRHFVPLISALAVLLIFVFVQYNSSIVAYAKAYLSPGNINPQNILVDPNLSLAVDPDPRLIIPKINVDIHIDYDVTTNSDDQLNAMKSSVAYFGIPGANSRPGQLGNVPLSGHSSNDFTDTGNAKFVFARLEQLQKGDIFYLNYESIRYTYAITRTAVVLPSQVNQLQVGSDKPYATLITCTPLGTAQKRLLVFAEQISPAPSKAKAAPDATGSTDSSAKLAGKSPTLIERAFGAN